jgi:hypothetical protein
MRKTLDKIVVILTNALSGSTDPHDSEITRVAYMLKNGWKKSNLDISRYVLYERGTDYFVFDRRSHKIAAEYVNSKIHEKASQEKKLEYLE